jgi:hypothetical protein
MAQVNIIERERRTLVALESTFGTTPAGSFPNVPTEIVLLQDGTPGEGATVEMLDVMDARVRRNDAIAPVQGLEIQSKWTAKSYLKAVPTANILTSTGAVGSLSHRILFRHLFGTEHAALGTTVATGTSATQFDVASATNLKKGTWICVTISGQPEPAKITNISGSTVTVSPALSGTPATSAVVRNLYNYAPAESHESSLAWQVAYVGDSAAQYTFNGAHGGFKLNFPFGQLGTLDLDMTAVAFTGASAQSIATTTVTDDMSTPFILGGPRGSNPAAVLFTDTAPMTRADTLVCESIELDMPNNWQMVRDPGGVQTVNSVVNVAGRPRAGSLKLRFRFTPGIFTAFDSNSEIEFAMWVSSGTGATRRFFVVEMPRSTIVGQPKVVKHGNELLYMDVELAPLVDTSVTESGETGADLDRIRAPYRVAFG